MTFTEKINIVLANKNITKKRTGRKTRYNTTSIVNEN